MAPRADRPHRDTAMWLHGTLAAIGCTLAYFAWAQPTWLETQDPVAVVEAGRGTLNRIVWQEPGLTIELRRMPHARPQGFVTTTWAQQQDTSFVRSPNAPSQASKPAQPAAPRPFEANAQAESLFSQLAHLRAHRRLGKLDEAGRRAAGLDAPVAALRLSFESLERTLRVGCKVYGSEDTFVLDEADIAYILPARALADFARGGKGLWTPLQSSLTPSQPAQL